jgi:hypothetical protein
MAPDVSSRLSLPARYDPKGTFMTDQKIEEFIASRHFATDDKWRADAVFLLRKQVAELDRLKARLKTWNDIADENTIVDRLQGIYRIPITDGLGPTVEGGSPTEHVNTYGVPPIQKAAAKLINDLQSELATLKASGTFSDGIEAAAKRAMECSDCGYGCNETIADVIRALTPQPRPDAQAQRERELALVWFILATGPQQAWAPRDYLEAFDRSQS